MTATTNAEKQILLRIAMAIDKDYNSSNIAKELNLSRVGAFKALKELEKKGLVKGKRLGKAIFYKVPLSDEYARKNVEVLLMEKARKYERWIDEFKDLSRYVDVIILFGSIIKDESKANDIDILLVFKKELNKKISFQIREKNEMLTKKIHPIKQTKNDLIRNIKKKDDVILSAIRNGVVLHGYDRLLEVIKNVTD
jgi:predicted nucleotidyltransferase